MTRTIRAIFAVAAMAPAVAFASPTEWMPQLADCAQTDTALEARVTDELASCEEDARADGFQGARALRAATDRCMQVRGWERAEKSRVESYDRFCELAERLQSSTDDDPVAVATIPNPNPA